MSTSSKKKEYLFVGELSKLTKIRASTFRYYTDLGLLPFEQEGDGSRRRYPKDETLKRLKEIQKLKDKRFTIEEIKEKLGKS